METFSTSQIEVLTGISAHKLRIWERRYGFLKPMRTKTNIRFYSEEQLKKLLNVGILTRNGIRISKIDKMTEGDIHENVTNILSNISSENHDEIYALVLHMMNFNEKEFQSVFQRCVIRKGFLNTILEVIYPFLNQIGILWGTNKIIASQEHFISNLIRQKLITAIDSLPMPSENAPSIALVLLDNEDHEIGLLLSSFIAKNMGWHVFYFGQRVPSSELNIIAEKINPDIILTLFIAGKRSTDIARIQRIIEMNKHIPFLFSGGSFSKELLNASDQCINIKNPDEYIDFLEKWPQNV
jgi:DNA-binding transcriptional MerR regulator